MPLRLIGLKQSTCSMRVFITLEEKGIDDYVLQEIDMMTGEHKKPPFTEKNPFGQIPVLEDGDLTVFESRAICRYLETKYKDQGTKLMPEPSDIKATILFEQWAAAELSHFDSAISSIYYQKVVKKLHGLEPASEILDESLQGLYAKLGVYNSILGKQRYMAGNEFSLVDIFFVPYVNRMFEMEIGTMVMERPHLKMWWETVSARPSVKKWSN